MTHVATSLTSTVPRAGVEANSTGVRFFVADPGYSARSEQLDPDSDWRFFGDGIGNWVVQTYLRLRGLGYPVLLTSDVPSGGTVVVHSDDMHVLLSRVGLRTGLFLVCARADREPNGYADIEIVQNPTQVGGTRTLHIAHWPQPGLLPREPARGARVKTIAYKGEASQLNEAFRSAEWRDFMTRRGYVWMEDEVVWKKNATCYDGISWNDYRNVDVILAARRNWMEDYPQKPASKLVNAWRAGVPAVLGAESAYRALRRSELDYIEIASLTDAKQAIEKLRQDSGLYEAMRANGLERAAEYSWEAVSGAWIDLLFKRLPQYNGTLAGKLCSVLPIGIRYHLRALCGI